MWIIHSARVLTFDGQAWPDWQEDWPQAICDLEELGYPKGTRLQWTLEPHLREWDFSFHMLVPKQCLRMKLQGHAEAAQTSVASSCRDRKSIKRAKETKSSIAGKRQRGALVSIIVNKQRLVSLFSSATSGIRSGVSGIVRSR
jgi:hypothetical protein